MSTEIDAIPTTAQKLRLLATAVRRNRRFNLMDGNHCIIAVGLRLNADGSMRHTRNIGKTQWEAKVKFAEKFGTSSGDTRDLYIGYLGKNEIVKNSFSTKQAASLLEQLAARYEWGTLLA